jgi:signal transduction histidine kinase/ligand-binding sensor domain-containing protein
VIIPRWGQVGRVQRALSNSSGSREAGGLSLAAVLALALSLAGLPLCAAVPNYYCARVWQAEDGLPQNAVTAIVQTRDGYLWVGTYSGLARFDGVHFEVFNGGNTPEMYGSRVTSLYEDAETNLWIGDETGGLTRHRDGQFHAVERWENWTGHKIVAMSADETNDLWMLNEDGLLSRRRDGLTLSPETGNGPGVISMARVRSGVIWVLRNGKVSRLERGALAPVKFDAESADDPAQGICASSDGGLWVATANHTRKWRENKWTEDWGPSSWGLGGTLTFIETRAGPLAAGIVDRGLNLILPGGGALSFTQTNDFPNDWVRSLCEDREGNLWVGTGNGGLAMVRAGNITTVNAPDQWEGRAVLSVCAARDGGLWASTEGAGLYRLRQGQWTHFGKNDGVTNLFVWSVSEDAQNRLWMGMWGGGLRVQRGERFEPVPGLEELTTPTPALLHARDGSVWVGTRVGLLHCNGNETNWFGSKQGLALPDVRAVVEDKEGAVWFGMLGGGLGSLKDGALRQFRKRDGLSSDFVQCLRCDNDGTLWIGTFGGGLNRLKKGRFAAITTRQGLADDIICHIEEDDHGDFWMSSHAGILCVSKNELNACADGQLRFVRCLAYGKGDGLLTSECSGGLQPAGCRTPDGRLWFTTSKGLVVVDPNEIKRNWRLPPVVIEELRVDEQPVARGAMETSRLRIPPGRSRLEFHYTGLSFASPEKVRFKYRLDGLDADWVDAGTKRFANYSYVPPGDYTFHVTACNNDGVWNESGAALSFTVLPRFWQTLWFRGLAWLLLAAAASFGVWFETRRRLRHRLERLERQRAIERERTRIANDIHDDLGASLTRITMLSLSAREELDNPTQAAAKLDRIYDTAREVTRALAEIVWAVNPRHDTLDSLASYVGKFAQDFLGAADIRCRLQLPVDLPAWPLTTEVRHNLFLAFKESLHNAVKHAQAAQVQVSLKVEPSAFVLSVKDDGRGFLLESPPAPGNPDPARAAHGNGLRNMRQRLGEIGGQCEIKSAPRAGTKVTFRVPVHVSTS